MRLSGSLFWTERETPADATDATEGLLRRAGYLEPVGPGLYVLGPLLERVLERLGSILREELADAGYQPIRAPSLRPSSDGRGALGPEPPPLARPAFTVTDRRGDELQLGPDGPDGVRSLAARHVRSYRDLPVRLLDIRTAFGDIEHRGGLLNSRESPRLDVYTFNADRTRSTQTHRAVLAAFERALERAGVQHLTARAGAPPGAVAASLVAPTWDGPDRIVRSPDGDIATPHASRAHLRPPDPVEERPAREVETPGAVTIEALREHLPDVPPARMLKTMLYRAELDDRRHQTVAALCRGDRQIDETKLRRHLGARTLEIADPLIVREVTGAQVGYAGPVGLPDDVRVVADRSAAQLEGFVCGANRTDAHLVDVRFGRDAEEPETADIDLTVDGDPSGQGGELIFEPALRLVDASQIDSGSSTGTVAYTDAEGQERDCWCHRASADLFRIVAGVVEEHRGEERLGWPLRVAPHSVVIVQVRAGDDAQDTVAEEVHRRLTDAGVDTIWDDRDERAGVKFGDAELIGVPIRVTVGRDADDGQVEVVEQDGEPQVLPLDLATTRIVERITDAGVPPVR